MPREDFESDERNAISQETVPVEDAGVGDSKPNNLSPASSKDTSTGAFSVGEEVECVDASGTSRLLKGERYTVKAVHSKCDGVRVNNGADHFYEDSRFRAVAREPSEQEKMMKCEHEPEFVVADILEGDSQRHGVKWCRKCGAYQRWFFKNTTVPGYKGRIEAKGEWRTPTYGERE